MPFNFTKDNKNYTCTFEMTLILSVTLETTFTLETRASTNETNDDIFT